MKRNCRPLVLTVLLFAPSAAAAKPDAAAKPNVVLIVCDDLNDFIGHLGGHPQARTPHMDALAQSEESTFETVRLGDLAVVKFKGRQLILIKPSTFMNLSGKAVAYWMQKEQIPLERVLVITDDLNLPLGTIRFKKKGSDGGHNGLKDIQERLNTTAYNRFRFGISDNFSKGRQVDYVLGQWTEQEQALLKERFKLSVEAVRSFALAGMDHTMNTYNGK